MIVNRTIWINPVEPHPLSFRAAVGLDTRLNVAFIGTGGAPHSSDLGAQLQLTGRTTSRTISYGMPATDIVNGKARATIPAGDLTDPNGYRLRMVGTLGGETALLAVGSVAPVAAAGIEMVPVDVIDTVPLNFDYNAPVELDVSVWTDAGKNSEYDLTSEQTTLSAAVYAIKGGSQLQPFSVTVLDANTVRLTLTAAQVNSLPPSCWWNLIASTASGATVLCEGTVTVAGTVTPPLVENTSSFDYQKPAAGNVNPVGGQIIHSNIAQNLLKVSKTTSFAVDLSATLELVTTGDQIVIGATTWTVQAALEAVGWYEFTVTPVAQAAVSGVTLVTFRRP
jgi:hypothetical protein